MIFVVAVFVSFEEFENQLEIEKKGRKAPVHYTQFVDIVSI